MELLLIAPSKNCLPNIEGFINHYVNSFNLDAVLAKINDLDPKKKPELKADLIIIPAEQSASYLNSHLLGGLELFVWLRIKGIKTHVIITSFFSLQQVMQKEKLSFVLGSKAVTFQQIPSYQYGIDFSKLVEDRAEDVDFKKHLPSIFNNLEFRHREANWWGVKSLWDVHNVIYNLKDSYPVSIEKYLQTLNNHIAKALFEYDEDSLKKGLIGLLHHNRSNIILSIESEIVKLLDKKTKVETLKKYFSIGRYKDENVVILKEAEINLIETQFTQLNNEKILVEQSDADIKLQLESWTNEIKTVNSKLLYIDDNAKNGWEEILRKMLHGVPVDSIVPNTKYKNNIARLYGDVIKPKLSPNTYTLIILDLRLFDETDINIIPSKLSGSQLLQEIRKDFAHLPILIISASNKRLPYSTLLNLGADAFWTKEGIDEYKTVVDTIDNYKLLISYIFKLHTKEYKYLETLTLLLQKCDGNNWWCSHTWSNGNNTTADNNAVVEVIQQIINLYKSYLQKSYIEQQNNIAETVFFLTSLINKFGLIVELIHQFPADKSYPDFLNNTFSNRIDIKGRKIRDLRNKSSHLSSLSLTTTHFFDAVDLLNEYILTGNTHKNILIDNQTAKQIIDNKLNITKDVTNYCVIWESGIGNEYIAEILIRESFTVKVDEDNNGVLEVDIAVKIPWATGTKAELKGVNGYLIGEIFGMNNVIYKVNKPLKKKINESPNKELICKYNKGSSCWELAT